MTGYDDKWVVKFVADTKDFENALKRISKLQTTIETSTKRTSQRGGQQGPVPGFGTGWQQGDFARMSRSMNALERQRQAAHQAEMRRQDQLFTQNVRNLNNTFRMRQREERRQAAADRQRRSYLRSEEAAYAERDRRFFARSPSQRETRLAQAEIAAHNENRRRQDAAQRERDRAARGVGSQAEAVRRAEIAAYAERDRRLVQSTRASDLNARLRERYEAGEARNANRSQRLNIAQQNALISSGSLGRRIQSAGLGQGYSSRLGALESNIRGATNFTELSQARADMRRFREEAMQAARAQERITREAERTGFAVNSMQRSMANFARSYLSIFAVIGAGREIYQNAKDMENLNTTLIMASGSADQAAKSFEKIKGVAQETGLSIKEMTRMYSNVVISAKDAKLGEKEQQAIFKGITTLSIGYGFNPEQQKLVGKAFSQMLGKQQVMAEEFNLRLIA